MSDAAPPTIDRLLAEQEWIRALARSLVVDRAAADDVAQDATLVALTRGPSRPEALRSWLGSVVRNLTSNRRRGEGRRAARELTSVVPGADAPGELVAQWEIRRQVVDAVLALDEPYRTTILLRFFEGLSVADAAARAGVPVETMKTRTRRGLELLRGRLAHLDDGGGRRGPAVLFLLARPDRAPASVPGSVVAGGVVMGMGTKLAAAIVLAAVAAGGAWWAMEGGGTSGKASPAASALDSAAGPARQARAGRPAAEAPVAAASAGAALPPPVDLAACDREKDVFGVVLDPDGRPVAGATVFLVRFRSTSVPTLTWPPKDPWILMERTLTASDGTFRLSATPGTGLGLRVDAAGYAVWESSARQAGERSEIRLVPGVALDVLVRTEADTPVDGAFVGLFLPQRTSMPALRTGADGRVRFERLPGGARPSVVVKAPALAVGMADAPLPATGAASVTVTLPAGRTIAGIVTDRVTGRPVVGASVEDDLPDEAKTDADGRFTLPGVSDARESVVRARATGYVAGAAYAAETGDTRIELEPAVRVVGRIVDTAGKPVPDADVLLIASWRVPGQPPANSYGGATTAEDGTFRVEGLAAGRPHQLNATAQRAGRAFLEGQTFAVSSAETNLGDVALRGLATLRGRTLAGAPLPGVTVRLGGPVRDRRVTDDLGRFAFADLPPGAYDLTLTSPGGETQQVDVAVAEGRDPEPVEVKFGAPPDAGDDAFVVRVVDDAGSPVAGIWVRGDYTDRKSLARTTDAQGDARFPSTPIHLLASPQIARLEHAYAGDREVHVAPGAASARIELARCDPIRGRVVDERGRPVENAQVAARGVKWSGALTAADGTFTLSPLAGTRAQVLAHRNGNNRGSPVTCAFLEDVQAGTKDLELVLRAPKADRWVVVRVLDGNDQPLEGVGVCVSGYSGTAVEGFTGSDGRARIEGVPAFPSYVALSPVSPRAAPHPANAWAPAVPVRLIPDGQEITVRKRPGVVLRGRVLLPDGAPAANAHVFTHNMGEEVMHSAVTNDAGEFSILFPRDTPGPWILTVRKSDERGRVVFETYSAPITAPADGVEIRFWNPR